LCTFLGEERNILPPAGIGASDRPGRNLVAVLAVLSQGCAVPAPIIITIIIIIIIMQCEA
jgi:hypothetical protein